MDKAFQTLFGNSRAATLLLPIAILLAVVVGVLFSQPIYANGGGGSSGDGSGGCSGSNTPSNYHCNKWGAGWRKYPISGSGPNKGFRDSNVTWNGTVKSTCQPLGADTVIAYVIGNNQSPKGWRSYDFGSNGTKNDQSGGDWITNDDAFGRFRDRLGGSGLRWGENVGWFCYSENNNWTINVGASITSSYNGSKPGDILGFHYQVNNAGPTSTNAAVTYSTKITRVNKSASSAPNLSEANGGTTLRNRANSTTGFSGTAAKGSAVGTILPANIRESGQSYTKFSDNRARYNISQDDVGRWICTVVTANPSAPGLGARRAHRCKFISYNWSTSIGVSITSKYNGVKPTDELGFHYRANNSGPTKTNATVTYSTKITRVNKSASSMPTVSEANSGAVLRNKNNSTTGFSGAASNGTVPGSLLAANIRESGQVYTRLDDNRSRYTITQDDVDRWICSVLTVNPGGYGSGAAQARSCKFIPYNYSITPRAPDNLPSSAEAGSTVTDIRGDVLNNGPTKSHSTTVWQLTSFVRRAGQAVGSAVNNGTAPCGSGESNALYNGNFFGAGCDSLARGSGSIPSSATRNLNAASVRVPSDLEVGDRFCFAVSARNRTHNPGSTPWRHSAPSCIIISKKPKVNILGGDLWVRGSTAANSRVAASTTNNTAGIYGSFVEYALATRGSVTGMSSAAGYQGRSTVNALCGVSLLTFGNNGLDNTGCSNQDIGTYSRLPSTTPRLQDRFTANSGNLSGTVSLNGRNGTFSAQNNISISSSTINSGRSVIIVAPNANATINGDIEYDDGDLSSVSDIPQVVIIARNIFINAAVNRVDAWLVANGEEAGHGYINTCGNGTSLGAGLNADTCDEPLLVNGPVIANHLLMRRTAGAGSLSRAGDPSEVFNLRPDAYLWMANRISAGVGLPTTATRELPPKY